MSAQVFIEDMQEGEGVLDNRISTENLIIVIVASLYVWQYKPT